MLRSGLSFEREFATHSELKLGAGAISLMSRLTHGHRMLSNIAFQEQYVDLLLRSGQLAAETDLRYLERLVASPDTAAASLHAAAEIFFREGHLRNSAAAARQWLTKTDEILPRWAARYFSYERFLREGVAIPPRRPRPVIDRTPGRVLSMLNWVPPYNTNGYATRTHKIALAFKSMDAVQWISHSRVGFPWDQRSLVAKPTIEVTDYEGIRYHHCRSDVPVQGDILVYIEAAALAIERIATRMRPALIHAASNYLNALPALIAARRLGLPFIYEVRGFWEISAAVENPSWPDTDRYGLDFAMESLVAREADRVLTLTPGMRVELMARGVEDHKIRQFPNCCDPSEIHETGRDEELAKAIGLKDGVVTLGYIGSVVKYEGLTDLVEACAVLRDEGHEFNMLLIGDGRDHPNVVKAVDDRGLRDCFHVIGRVPYQEVDRYYSLIDVVTLPRRPYAVCEIVSPLKPLEALLLRKLVFASNVGGMSDMIRDGETGVAFNKGDLGDMTRRLREIVSNFHGFNGVRENGRQWVLTERLWTKAIERLQDDLEDLAGFRSRSQNLDRTVFAVTPGQRIQLDRFSSEHEQGASAPQLTLSWKPRDNTVDIGNDLIHGDQHGVPSITTLVPPHAEQLTLSPCEGAASSWQAFTLERPGVFRSPQCVMTLLHHQGVSLHGRHAAFDVACRDLDAIELVASVYSASALRVGDALCSVEFLDTQGQPLIPLMRPDFTAFQWSAKVGWYVYLPTLSPILRIPIALPPGTDRVIFTLRRWNSEQREIIIGRYAHVRDYTTGKIIFSCDLLAQEDLPSPDTSVELSSQPLWSIINVNHLPRLRIEGHINDVINASGKPALIAIDFLDGKGASHIKNVRLSYADQRHFYYQYIDGIGKSFSLDFTLPEKQALVAVALLRWRSEQVIARSAMNIVTRTSRERFLLNANPRSRNIFIYSDSDGRDVHALMAAALAKAVAALEGACVYLLADSPSRLDTAQSWRQNLTDVTIVDPWIHLGATDDWNVAAAARWTATFDSEIGGFDWVIAVGWRAALQGASHPRLHDRFIAWIDDLPDSVFDDPETFTRVVSVANSAAAILFAEENHRTGVAAKFPTFPIAAKAMPALWSTAQTELAQPAEGVRLLYWAPLTPSWRVETLLTMFTQLHADDPTLELHMIIEPETALHDHEWTEAIVERLTIAPGVHLHREPTAEAASHIARDCHLAWCATIPAYDHPLTARDPLIRVCQIGIPPIIAAGQNGTAALGADYPLVLRNENDVDALRRWFRSPDIRSLAAQTANQLVADRHPSVIANDRLANILIPRQKKDRLILLAGSASQKLARVAAEWIARGYRVQETSWPDGAEPDTDFSRQSLRQADVVIASATVAASCLNFVRPDSKLLIDVGCDPLAPEIGHRLAANTSATIIFEDEVSAQRLSSSLDFEGPAIIIPEAVDPLPTHFSIPRDRFLLGFFDIVGHIEHFSGVLDILAELHARDRRFRLVILGEQPTKDARSRDAKEMLPLFLSHYRHIATTTLQDAITFVNGADDKRVWLRRFGWLITSQQPMDRSSTTQADAEGCPVMFLPEADGGSDGIDSQAIATLAATLSDPEAWQRELEDAVVRRIKVGRDQGVKTIATRWIELFETPALPAQVAVARSS